MLRWQFMALGLPLALMFAGTDMARSASAGITVGELRCEYAVNPIGVDSTQPRLSWVLQSNERGQRQSAYQICVAASAEALVQGKDLLWDTGRVESDQNVHVVYAGKPLQSETRCFWKVRPGTERRRFALERTGPLAGDAVDARPTAK